MKRILILTITILAFFISSCNQKHCWNCTITYKNSVQFPDAKGNPGTGVKTQQVCDKTKKEIQTYESDNTLTDEANNTSVTYECGKDYYR